MMNRYLFIIITFFVVVLSTIFLHTSTAHAVSYDTSNLIGDSIYYNKSSMSQDQIQNFINAFPQSCLLPQNYPSGLGQITFKEPLDYFTYSTSDVSPARIIWDASQMYSINPQVLLVTLEKEQNLVSGGAGCATWKYNSAMGYNCPDGSESALKDYPDSGIYGTCVAKESNAGFTRQVNHAAWQLSFDGKRANGDLTWMGDGDTPYYGRMTQGWRQSTSTGASVYYDGYTTIDGQSVYLSNGPTAALYNYTPHFNNFNPIFTSWFGSPTGEVDVVSPLTVTSSFSQGLFTNNTITAQFTLKNTTGQTQDLGTMAIGGRDSNGTNYDFGSQHIILSAGQQYVFTASRTLSIEGSYTFNIINYRDGYGWSDSYPDSINNYSRVVANTIVQNIPTVTVGPLLDNANLHINQPTNIRFTVQNSSIYPVNLGYFGLAITSPSGRNADLPFDTVNALAPGAAYNYVQTFTPVEAGTYNARVSSTGDNGVTWLDALYPAPISPATNRLTISVKADPTLTQGLTVSDMSPRAGDTVTGTFKVKNFGNAPIVINKNLCYILRDSQGTNNDLGCLNIGTIQPGQELTFTGSRQLAAGQYHAYFSTHDSQGWHDNQSFVQETGSEPTLLSFTVKANPTLTQGLTISSTNPHDGDLVTGSFKVADKGTAPVTVNKDLCYILRDAQNRNNDFGCLTIGTLQPGQELTYTGSRKLAAGQYHAYFSTHDSQGWHDNQSFDPETGTEPTSLSFIVRPNPTLTQGLTITNQNPHAGDTVTGTFSITNEGTSAVTVNKSLCYIVRDAQDRNNDFGCLAIGVIQPSQVLVYTGNRVLAAGTYKAYFSMYDGQNWNDNWSFSPETGTEVRNLTFVVAP